MKTYEGPLEENRHGGIEASSYGKGTKEHFDTFGFMYIRGFVTEECIDCCQEKVRYALWDKVDLSPKGNIILLLQTEGTSKIIFNDKGTKSYVVLNEGDGFLYKKDFKLKHKKPWFKPCDFIKIHIRTND